MNPPVVEIPVVTGNFQRKRLCVGSTPRKVRESIDRSVDGNALTAQVGMMGRCQIRCASPSHWNSAGMTSPAAPL